MKSRPPLHGYNTNYRREGKVYHVQTEDLGPPAAAVVTQVFTGGTILAVKKTQYVEIFDDPEAEGRVRDLMRKQHKALLVALRDGTIGQEGQTAESLTDSQLAIAAESSRARDDDTVEQVTEIEDSEFDIVDDGVNLRDTMRMERPPNFADALIAEGKRREAARAASKTAPPAAPSTAPPPARPEPAAGAREEPPPVVPRDVTPPVISERKTAPSAPPKIQPKKTMPLFATAAGASPPPVPAAARKTGRPPAAPAEAKGETGKRPSRSPRVFSDVSHGRSSRGEDQLVERSLDEVILSYLAEDLQDE